MDEKPIHVQVAEALGWSEIDTALGWKRGTIMLPETVHPCFYLGYPPLGAIIGQPECVPRYDTDWSATGPLVECLSLELYRKSGNAPWRVGAWLPNDRPEQHLVADGSTPLLAVCNLLIKAGKLCS